jgi:uncharacterized protein
VAAPTDADAARVYCRPAPVGSPTMPEPSSPQDVLDRLLEGIAGGDWQALHGLYSDDAVIEYPFALPKPRRLEGKEAIRRYFEGVARLPLQLRARNVRMHETGDPEVLVVEYDYEVSATASSRTLQVSNIQVSRVRHGRIIHSRDYHNHVVLADATGQLSAVVAAMTSVS